VNVTLGDIHQPEQQKVISYLEKGQLFGEIALLCSSRRVANVIAEQDTQVMVLERDIFLEQIKKEPEKLQFILELLGSRFLDIVKHVK
jgi:CRP-like cAMP-binding protein